MKKYEADPDAIAKYREFNRFDPKHVGPMKGLVIPPQMRRAGVAKHVIYRSMKIDPETLVRPRRRGVDYIHEHDAGVYCYLPDGDPHARGGLYDVPDVALDPDANFVLLGKCLGFKVDDTEAQGTEPLPELYCTVDGKVLLVIQSKRELVAAMWGGGLGVFARGIDG